MRNLLLLLGTAALSVFAQKPDLDVKGSFGEINPFAKVINGQSNKLYLTLDNHSPESLVVKSISGAWSEKTSASSGVEKFLKNSTTQSHLAVPIPPKSEGVFQPPTVLTYQFWSEFKPRELLLTVWVDFADAAGRTYREVAYEGQVTVEEAPGSFFDPALLFAYAMVLALVGGAGYLAYNIYNPPTKKSKRAPAASASNEPATPVDPEEWIPVHHKKSKKGSAAGATSGEESEAAEGYASEKSAGGARSRKGRK